MNAYTQYIISTAYSKQYLNQSYLKGLKVRRLLTFVNNIFSCLSGSIFIRNGSFFTYYGNVFFQSTLKLIKISF